MKEDRIRSLARIKRAGNGTVIFEVSRLRVENRRGLLNSNLE